MKQTAFRFFRWLGLVLAGLSLAGSAWAALPLLQGFGSGAASSAQSVVETGHVRAELLAYAPQGVTPGATVWVGLKMTHQPGWHTYWENPGDIGMATGLEWTLPVGVMAHKTQWPVPQRLPVAESIMDYGYSNTILLPVQLHITPDFQQTQLKVELNAQWLACQVECVPESANLVLQFPAMQSTVSEIGAFEAAWKALPQTLPEVSAQAQVSQGTQGTQVNELNAQVQDNGVIKWRVQGLPPHMQGQSLVLFPKEPEIIVNTGPSQSGWENDTWVATFNLLPHRQKSPQPLSAVLALENAAQLSARVSTEAAGTLIPFAVTIEAPVSGPWPAAWQADAIPAISAISPALQTGAAANTAASGTWLGALLLAFVGGLLLNLMPCVFPVLSIKALTFAQSGHHTRRMHMATGLAYGVGVVATILLLAGVLLALRAAGAGLGWGFQLQSPVFVALLAGLFTLISLNLLGVFQVVTILPAGVGSLRSKTPTVDAFFSGIISVLIATPCTAPFMGAALGAAMVLPTVQALLVFVALGVGLALPLMLIAFVPALARWLPKPGAWMETFRRLMAFPMLATVLWLVWVIGLQTSVDGAVAMLAILLALSLLVWVWGWGQLCKLQQKARNWRKWALALSGLFFVGVAVWASPMLRLASSDHALAAVHAGWQPWSAEKVQQLQAQGKPVFIDFTAAWCVTCQVNKRSTLMQPDVLKAFADKGVVLLRADWTRPDPAIAAELGKLGRSGLPVYVLLVLGKAPELLPEVLTPGIVYQALEALP